jgi:hypothetical protein
LNPGNSYHLNRCSISWMTRPGNQTYDITCNETCAVSVHWLWVNINLTIMKLYPVHMLRNPLGQFGIVVAWLWTATTWTKRKSSMTEVFYHFLFNFTINLKSSKMTLKIRKFNSSVFSFTKYCNYNFKVVWVWDQSIKWKTNDFSINGYIYV